MSDLVTWLRAQLDEDERDARRHYFHTDACYRFLDPGGGCSCDYSDRVLAEVEAKRRILDAVERYLDPHPGQPCTNERDEYWESEPCYLHVEWMKTAIDPYVLPLLALPYADRPGYREEWRPGA